MAYSIIAANTSKRKRVPHSLEIKQQVYKKLKAGTSTAAIVSEYGLSRATISEIKNVFGPRIEEFIQANPDLIGRKSMKTRTYPQLEKALLLFFKQQRALGIPISGSLLTEKANILQEKYQHV